MSSKASVHYSISDAGGISPNVVQPIAKLIYMVREETVQKAKALLKRVDNIAKGAALMTDTEVTCRQIDGTASTLSNQTIENVLHDNLVAAPQPEYTEDEIIYAKQLRATYDTSELPGSRTYEDFKVKKFVLEQTENGTRPINNFVFPHTPCNPFSPGSTDVGDVSWLTPTAQFTAVTWPSGSPGHSWQITACAGHSIGYKGMLYGGEVVAAAALKMIEEPGHIEKAKEEFDRVMKGQTYKCPIGPEIPIPQPQI